MYISSLRSNSILSFSKGSTLIARCYAAIAHATLYNLVAHSCLGRPVLRTYLSVAGRRVLGQKVRFLKISSLGKQAILRKSLSCCFNSWFEKVIWRACFKTSTLEMREMNAGLMFKMFLRHLAWKPFSLHSSATLSQAELSPYSKRRAITD